MSKNYFALENNETNRHKIERYHQCLKGEIWRKEGFSTFREWVEVKDFKGKKLGGRVSYIRWYVEEFMKPLSGMINKHEELLYDTNIINFLTAPGLRDTPKLRRKYPFLVYKGKLLSRQTLLEDVIDIEKIKREKLFDEEFTVARYKEKFREFWAEFEKDPSNELGHEARYDHLAELWKYIYRRNYVPNNEGEYQNSEATKVDLMFELQRELNELKKSLSEFENNSIKFISQFVDKTQKKVGSLDYIIEQYNNMV